MTSERIKELRDKFYNECTISMDSQNIILPFCKKPEFVFQWFVDNFRDSEIKTPKVNRVEVINKSGRDYVNWKDGNKVYCQLQDDDRTLKVFISNHKSQTL